MPSYIERLDEIMTELFEEYCFENTHENRVLFLLTLLKAKELEPRIDREFTKANFAEREALSAEIHRELMEPIKPN